MRLSDGLEGGRPSEKMGLGLCQAGIVNTTLHYRPQGFQTAFWFQTA
ncbi:hypothetical protein HMPREF9120_01301 [Neisseria sp. oral taxon 020 str. F0370]|nr:hypothetical protein HMPREF9120_01301 [Neisseria sp. oral taxon 020 str. F0370]